MKMVLAYVMMIGLRPILAQRNRIWRFILENAVAHATVQNSTTVSAVKLTESSLTAYAHATKTGSEKTVVNETTDLDL